jgi:hypothetical protein
MAIANTTIQVRKSGTTGVKPTSLANGELAINYADNKLYYKDGNGNISHFYGANNGPGFATANANNTLVLATLSNDTLSITPGNNVTITACTTTKTITVNAVLDPAFDAANNAGSFANSAYVLANNTVGVDVTQNTNISSAQSFANSAFVTANSASSNTVTIQGVDTTQNTNITSAQSFANSAFTTANSGASFANAAFTTANSGASFANAAFTTANSASSNTVTTQGVDVTQNTNITIAQSFANGAFSAANSKLSASGFTNNGLLYANGTGYAVNGSNLTYDGSFLLSSAIIASNTALGGQLALRTNGTDLGYISGVSQLLGSGNGNDLALWATAGNAIRLYTNGNNLRASFDTNGNFLVGTTSIPGSLGNSLTYIKQGATVVNDGATVGYFQLYNSNAGANLKTWRMGNDSSGNFILEQINDAYTSVTDRVKISSTGTITLNALGASSTNTFTTASTSQVSIDSFATANYRSAKYLVQMTSGTSYGTTELMLIHDGTNVFLSQYGDVNTGTVLGSFDATITSGNLNLLFTATNSVTTVKLMRSAIAV